MSASSIRTRTCSAGRSISKDTVSPTTRSSNPFKRPSAPCRSMLDVATGVRVPGARTCPVSIAACSAATMMCWSSSDCSCDRCAPDRRRSQHPRMTWRRLLTSCATAPAVCVRASVRVDGEGEGDCNRGELVTPRARSLASGDLSDFGLGLGRWSWTWTLDLGLWILGVGSQLQRTTMAMRRLRGSSGSFGYLGRALP